MANNSVTRRQFTHSSLGSFLAAFALPSVSEGLSQSNSSTSSRREVTKQRLPGNPERQLTLVEIIYPPGTGSPPHVHANGVMAFVLSGSVASKVGGEPERIFRSGEAWWEPPGATHRVSRNASSSEEARLLAIYIAPFEASETDLMRPI